MRPCVRCYAYLPRPFVALSLFSSALLSLHLPLPLPASRFCVRSCSACARRCVRCTSACLMSLAYLASGYMSTSTRTPSQGCLISFVQALLAAALMCTWMRGARTFI